MRTLAQYLAVLLCVLPLGCATAAVPPNKVQSDSTSRQTMPSLDQRGVLPMTDEECPDDDTAAVYEEEDGQDPIVSDVYDDNDSIE